MQVILDRGQSTSFVTTASAREILGSTLPAGLYHFPVVVHTRTSHVWLSAGSAELRRDASQLYNLFAYLEERMNFLRRLRGIAVTAVTWGTVFAAAGVAVGVVLDLMGLTQPLDFPHLIDVLARVGVRWAKIGAGMGALFATTIILTQRKRTVADLSTSRFSLLGLTAGGVVSFVVSLLILLATGRSLTDALTPGLTIAAVCAAVGAGVATSTLRLARRAEEPIALVEERDRDR